MEIKIINDFDLKKQSRELGVKVWQTPSFLFIMLGLVIIFAITATYYISKSYDSPEALIGIEVSVVVVLLTVGSLIIHEVEEIAKLNKSKSEFVFIASHQLRTPLSGIAWQVELLLSKYGTGLNGKQKSGLKTIALLNERMTRLVNDLLDVARIDRQNLFLKEEKFDLAEVVDQVVQTNLPLINKKNIKIIFKKKKRVFLVLGDAEKLKLAVENLIGNAVKYTSNSGKIEIGIIKNDEDYVFTVRDNGIGIPEYQQKQVFNKFFRSEVAMKYQAEGTGLGLFIAKNVIEQSGGKIWFKSTEGVGTVFCFSMPRAS
jgi:signal transduction histidine kinase